MNKLALLNSFYSQTSPITKKLNLGCGDDIRKDYINVDIRARNGVDKVVDLNRVPWDFQDGEFDEIYAKDIIEHLGKLTKVEIIEELARITKSNGLVTIRVPCLTHFWALASLQHAHSFFYNSFEPSFAQTHFSVEEIRVGFGDEKSSFKFNRFWRFVCKYMTLVQVITFKLKRK